MFSKICDLPLQHGISRLLQRRRAAHHQPQVEVTQHNGCAVNPSRPRAQALFPTHLRTQWMLPHCTLNRSQDTVQSCIQHTSPQAREQGVPQPCQLATASPQCWDRVQMQRSPGSEGCNGPRGVIPPLQVLVRWLPLFTEGAPGCFAPLLSILLYKPMPL